MINIPESHYLYLHIKNNKYFYSITRLLLYFLHKSVCILRLHLTLFNEIYQLRFARRRQHFSFRLKCPQFDVNKFTSVSHVSRDFDAKHERIISTFRDTRDWNVILLLAETKFLKGPCSVASFLALHQCYRKQR